jgi:hypothetical protein
MRILKDMTFNEAEMATSMNVRSLPEEAITLNTSTETTETIGIIEGIADANDANTREHRGCAF